MGSWKRTLRWYAVIEIQKGKIYCLKDKNRDFYFFKCENAVKRRIFAYRQMKTLHNNKYVEQI